MKSAEFHSVAPFIVWIHPVILEVLMVTVPTNQESTNDSVHLRRRPARHHRLSLLPQGRAQGVACHGVLALRFLPRQHGHRAEHQGRRGEPGEPPRRDQVLTSLPIARTFRRQQWPGALSPASSATAAHRSPEAGSWPERRPTAPPTSSIH